MTPPPLPKSLYTAEGVRRLDRAAIEGSGIAGMTLMERAGAAAFAVLGENWPWARRLAVVCGAGNNAGDGYVVARLAHAAGLAVTVLECAERGRLKGDARTAAELAMTAGIVPQAFDATLLAQHDLIVDALLGTGLAREVGGAIGLCIDAINGSGVPVLAIDLPSGLDADTGSALGRAVIARATITFVGVKQGLLTGAGPDHCGRLYHDDLGVPAAVYRTVEPSAERLDLSRWSAWLRPRRPSAHKGHFGHVLVVGGEIGYAGAARMAAEAALRVGAGLVSLATRARHAAEASIARPEIMCHPIEEPPALGALCEKANVVAIGPGLGRSPWAVALLARALDCGSPLCLDADGLNLLAEEPMRRDDWVLTPHPGEAGRLLGCDTEAVQADRFEAARELQRRYGGVVVLKGGGTLVCDRGGRIAVCDAGNAGMASGGMGDVLTGVIAGLIAQGLSPNEAAALGVCLHALAGDRAALAGQRGTLAMDLMPHLRALVNPAE
ncbi:MAG: NAD(P)H-hydrate dehydratase [Beggiatoa sp.]|nr:NAD(P)H-hydrate dehydratase [Beggiatoa sp.]